MAVTLQALITDSTITPYTINGTFDLSDIFGMVAGVQNGAPGDIHASFNIPLGMRGVLTNYNITSNMNLGLTMSATVGIDLTPIEATFDSSIIESGIESNLYRGANGSLVIQTSLAGMITGGAIGSGILSVSLKLNGSGNGLQSRGHGSLICRSTLIGSGRSTLIAGNSAKLIISVDIKGRGRTGAIGSGSLKISNDFDISGSAYVTSIGSGSLTFGLSIQGQLFLQDFFSLVLNLRNFALTEYDFGLLGLAKFNGAYLGISKTNLYELTGGTDNGTRISWYFKTGKFDMEQQVINNLRHAWVSARPTGDLVLTVGSSDNEWEYPILSIDENDNTVRLKVGKGIRSKYLDFKIKNEGIEQVFIDHVKLFTEQHKGKLR